MTIEVAAPPEVPAPTSAAQWSRLLPVGMAVVMTGMAVTVYRSAPGTPRSPMLLVFPVLMLVSAGVTAIAGRRTDLDADRRGYLAYLSGLRQMVARTAAMQRSALAAEHPDPAALWTTAGGAPRRPEELGSVRIGIGTVPLATPLVAARAAAPGRADPVTAGAVHRFIDTHGVVASAPVTISLGGVVTLDGEPDAVRGLLRAMICQLAVRYGPERLLLAGVFDAHARCDWDWLKWLPHHQHPVAAGQLRFTSVASTLEVVAGVQAAHTVVVVDGDLADHSEPIPPEVTLLQVGTGGAHSASSAQRLILTADGLLRRGPDDHGAARPDRLSLLDAQVCARQLAGAAAIRSAAWADLAGVGDPARFDPITLWRNRKQHDLLRVPLGTTTDGAAVELDIKEAALGGMGPHGLCIGATGSGKSELLRTIVLGMVARHAPDELNLVLVDFKGGATFLGLEGLRHVAAVITNLADAAPLVTRMRDALAGEMTRRQELLRAAGCDSLTTYRAGAAGAPLPALFIVVDEFSELLSQHPDFVDMFVAIGRLGRSLGIHLLLASQRIDEGRLRGLESNLSYRICLKTLTGDESRLALGSTAAYELPATPGAGYLRSASSELIRFHAAYVSGRGPAAPAVDATAQLFSAEQPATLSAAAGSSSVLQTVVARLAGRGTPAHRVWLPPLGSPPALGALLGTPNMTAPLQVPIGIVDRPREQRYTPLVIDLAGATGNLAVVGGPQSGKSTALCVVVAALAATQPGRQVQFYCLDFGGGVLDALRPLAPVGAVASAAHPELVRRIVGELAALIGRREARFRVLGISSMADYRRLLARRDPRCADDPFGDVFLVVDGWASVRRDFDTLEESITALAAVGLSFGVHVVVSAARWAELRPALKDQLGTRIELRLGDPADSEDNRGCAQQVPIGAPGRGLAHGGLHMQIADPCDVLADLAARGDDRYPAPPMRMLPECVAQATVRQAAGGQLQTAILLGLAERDLKPVAIDFAQQPHLLVFGEAGSGKTSVLRGLCAEITGTARAAQLVVVDYRRALLGVVAAEQLRGYAASAPAVTEMLPDLLGLLRQRLPGAQVTPQQLRDRSWWSGPEVYLVVDDYDLVAGAGNPLAPIAELLPYSADLGLHVLLARRAGGAARAMYEPLLAGLRDLGAMGLMLSGSPDDGPLIDSVRPMPLPPGRGTLVTRSHGAQRIQVGWSPPP